MINWFEPVTVLGSVQVEGNHLTLPASLECVGSLCLDRKIVLKADQQKRPELAFKPIHLPDAPKGGGKTPGLNPARRAVNVRAGEQRCTTGTNKSDRGQLRPLDLSGS